MQETPQVKPTLVGDKFWIDEVAMSHQEKPTVIGDNYAGDEVAQETPTGTGDIKV